MDDVIIFSSSLTEHISNLKLVFRKLRESKLKIQPDKCEFLRKEVEFLGHIVTTEGIKPNPKKIEAIQKFPIPKTSKEIKSFLGLLGYYRRFINNFAKLTKPFTRCLKKGARIEHTPEFIKTFELCKTILTNDPILQYPDFEKTFILSCDASNFAVAAVLSQGKIGSDLPIAYASRTLNSAECNYSTIEKELLAIVFGVKYFRPYVWGRKFIIVSDHKPLQYLLNLKQHNPRLLRWKLLLEQYDYTIQYKPGKANSNVDALSRVEIHAIDDETNESVIVSPGDVDEDITQYLQSADEDVNITLDELLDIEEIFDPKTDRNPDKINILSDIQIAPAPVQETDEMTVHTAVENPVLEIPFTENVINRYLNQIVILQKASYHYHIVRSKPLEHNNRLTLYLSNNIEEEIVKFFKEYVDPMKKYCIFIKESEIKDLSIEISKILPRYFKNHSYRLCFSNQILKDISDPERQKELIVHHHETKTCHRGINETLMALKRLYYWNNMQKMVSEYINNCDLCQTTKYDRQPPKIKFSLTPTPKQPLELLHLDTFRFSNAKFLTIIDVFSKYAQAYILEPICTASTIYEGLLTFINHHGIPQSITCDSGTEYKNSIITDFCKLHKIQIRFATPNNSNSSSPINRFHSTILEILRILRLKYSKLSPKELMQQAILAYNSTIHSVTKQRPFDLINGRLDALDPFDLSDEVILNQFITDRKERLKFLYGKIHESSASQKEKIIEKRNETREDPPTFQPGTSAFVKDKTAAWEKTKPRFIKTTVKADLGTKIRGMSKKRSKIAHKSQVRKPKAYCSISQEYAANETACTSSSSPSCSRDNKAAR
nr:unnamed protein product [Callosobruchus analis]